MSNENRIADAAENTVVFYDENRVGYFEDATVRKFNNAVRKMLDEVTETPGIKVSFIASNRQAALYAVAYRSPEGESHSDSVCYKYKYKEWTMTMARCKFTREFVCGYIRSIYGMRSVSEEDIVRELVMHETWHGYGHRKFGEYAASCCSGGIEVVKNTTCGHVHYLGFFPYEELDQEKVGSFYGDLLRLCVDCSTEFRPHLVPKELLMELAGLRPVVDEYGMISDFERVENK